LVFVILGGAFVADATVTLMRRVCRGDRVWEAHRDHAYQRLARTLGGHRPVTLGGILLTVALASFGAAATFSASFFIPMFVCAAALLGVVLVAIERRAPFRSTPQR